MNLSLRMPRVSALDQVSWFMTWHQRHHHDCNDMITNFFSRAARAKVASLHSLQKPSALSIGAARATVVNDRTRISARIRIMTSPNEWMLVLIRNMAGPCYRPNTRGRELFRLPGRFHTMG